MRTSATARFRPLAPVGGTMCAASPARNSLPYCIGSTTKLRMPVMPFCSTGPSSSFQFSSPASLDLQLLPDFLVRPIQKVFVGTALEIKAADARRTHAEQRETAIVVGVDEFFRRRRRFGENAQPAERIHAIESGENAFGQRRAADAMITVAASDEIADEFARLAVFAKADGGFG